MFKQAALAVLGAAALATPGLASAQAYGRPDPAPYDSPRGDWYGRGGRFSGYPEFRGIEDHIRREIWDGVRQDLIERDDARDLLAQLQDIKGWEAREFRIHGWRLPNDDRARLRDRLDQLDQLVDQIREEP